MDTHEVSPARIDAARQDEATRDAITDDSVELIEKLDELKTLELQKRRETMSSAPFHALATRITRTSRDIFGLAHREERDGDALSETQHTSIDEELAND